MILVLLNAQFAGNSDFDTRKVHNITCIDIFGCITYIQAIDSMTRIKTIQLKDEVGMAGSKSTQTRFVRHKHLLYFPSLAFLDYYAPINVDVFVECGMWETFRVVPWLSQWFRIVSFDSVVLFCNPQKASVGMYSRCLSRTNLVLTLPSLLYPSIVLFFILVSVLFYCS